MGHGADLKWLANGILGDPVALAEYQDSLADLCTALMQAPQAVIAAVQGYALAGLEVILACDIVVAAADAKLGRSPHQYETGSPLNCFLATDTGRGRGRWTGACAHLLELKATARSTGETRETESAKFTAST